MRLLKTLAAALALATLCACASIPASLSLDESSNQGLIIIEASTLRPGIQMPEFSLNIARYSDAENRLEASSFGGWAQVNSAARGADGRYWLIARAPPGRYVITALTHQTYWMACFNAGTRAFTVEPGRATFLGRIDPTPSLLTMATTLPSLTTTYVYALDQRISFVSASQLGDWEPGVRRYLEAAFPNITAPLVAGASDAVTFNTGWDLTYTSRVCGGYYAPEGLQQ
ncbi:MAG: hypothetical protein K2X34_12510 [Hyphomonadaceae bacterium]|nr:hypothetical protein [Hyphomonadaceae bacterium]